MPGLCISAVLEFWSIEIRRTSEFADWLRHLRDNEARLRIVKRLRRLERAKRLGGSVTEIRVNYGPDYRVYFTRRGNTVAVLLCGGDKRTQDADIARARQLAKQWKD